MNFNNPYMPQMHINNGINWVQGLEGASAYQLPPNSNAVLIDSTRDVMYIKSFDNIGMPTLRTFEFKEVTDKKPEDKYITRDEFNRFLDSLGGNRDVAVSRNERSERYEDADKEDVRDIQGKSERLHRSIYTE